MTKTMNENKPLLFVDMDNVLADFGAYVHEHFGAEPTYTGVETKYDEIPGIFSKFKPVEGAVEALRILKEKYNIFILSTAPWNNPSAWADKLEWVKKYFSDIDGGDKDKEDNDHPLLWKRLILSHHKDLCFCQDAWLVDDCNDKNGAPTWYKNGKQLWFGHKEDEARAKDWPTVVDFLMNQV
jgi:hypothetical protein